MTRASAARWPLVATFVLALAPIGVRAQQPSTDAVSESQFRFGPVGLNPGIVFVAGYDSNLNGEAVEVIGGPQMFAIPQVRGWTQVKRLVFGGAAAAEFIRIEGEKELTTLEGQPNANYLTEGLVGMTGPGLSWHVLAQQKETTAKPTGFEIGARSRRLERLGRVSTDLRFAGRLSVAANASALRTQYDADAIYSGSQLNETLDSLQIDGNLSLVYEVTPVTSLFASVGGLDFEYFKLPERNTTATSYGGGISFDPAGLLSGSVAIGNRVSRTPGMGEGQLDGLVIKGQVSHTRPSGGTLSVTLTRDRQFSFDVEQGAYTVKGGDLYGARPLFGRWIAFAHGSLHYLDYGGETAHREDHVEYGGGITFQRSPRLRIGAYVVDTNHRSSNDFGQSWDGLVANFYIMYGRSHVRPLDRPLPP